MPGPYRKNVWNMHLKWTSISMAACFRTCILPILCLFTVFANNCTNISSKLLAHISHLIVQFVHFIFHRDFCYILLVILMFSCNSTPFFPFQFLFFAIVSSFRLAILVMNFHILLKFLLNVYKYRLTLITTKRVVFIFMTID